MLFIAGISPKIKSLDPTPRRCPTCGLHQAYLKRIDHYLSLFFIPLLRVKKGTPFVSCDRCESGFFRDNRPDDATPWSGRRCKFCGKRLKDDFKFCPECGQSI